MQYHHCLRLARGLGLLKSEACTSVCWDCEQLLPPWKIFRRAHDSPAFLRMSESHWYDVTDSQALIAECTQPTSGILHRAEWPLWVIALGLKPTNKISLLLHNSCQFKWADPSSQDAMGRLVTCTQFLVNSFFNTSPFFTCRKHPKKKRKGPLDTFYSQQSSNKVLASLTFNKIAVEYIQACNMSQLIFKIAPRRSGN